MKKTNIQKIYLTKEYKNYEFGNPTLAAKQLINHLKELRFLVDDMQKSLKEAGDLSSDMKAQLRKDIEEILSELE